MNTEEQSDALDPRLVPARAPDEISFEEAFAQAMQDRKLQRFYDLTDPYPTTPTERPLHQTRSSRILVPTDRFESPKDLAPAHARCIDTRCGAWDTRRQAACGAHVARSVGSHPPGQRWALVTSLLWCDRGGDPVVGAVRHLAEVLGPWQAGFACRWAWTGRTEDAMQQRHGAYFLDGAHMQAATHPRGHRGLAVRLDLVAEDLLWGDLSTPVRLTKA